jgi:hypothetical protein
MNLIDYTLKLPEYSELARIQTAFTQKQLDPPETLQISHVSALPASPWKDCKKKLSDDHVNTCLDLCQFRDVHRLFHGLKLCRPHGEYQHK